MSNKISQITIGVDLRPLQGHNKYRGIGRHISSTLEELVKLDDRNHYVFYEYSGLDDPMDRINVPLSFKYVVRQVPQQNKNHIKGIGILFKQHKVLNLSKDKLDVFFQTDVAYGIPKNVKVVAIFYDLIPYLYWNKDKLKQYSGIRKIKNVVADSILRQKYLFELRQYKKANKIIAISDSSKRDLIKKFPSIQENNVKVSYLGVDTIGVKKATLSSANLLKKLRVSKPFLLYVGGVDLRKNIVGLAKIFSKLKKHGNDSLKMVMIGKEFSNIQELTDLGWYKTVKGSRFERDIIFPGYVSDEELMQLYSEAEVFVFPSLYEGFGLPILESMKAGCPVVAFNNSSIPEVAGKAAILANNEKEFIDGVNLLLHNKFSREKLIKAGYKQIKKFSWKNTAKDTLEIIMSAAKEQS